jgi:hypothetical protein
MPDGMPLWAVFAVSVMQTVVSVVVAVIQSNRLNIRNEANMKKQEKGDNERIENGLRGSPTIRRINEKLDHDWEHENELDRQVLEIKMMILRQDLFVPSRTVPCASMPSSQARNTFGSAATASAICVSTGSRIGTSGGSTTATGTTPKTKRLT